MSVDRRVFSYLSYGLYVVTSSCDGRGNGQIANVLFQVTSQPPRLAVALNKDNFTYGLVARSGLFAATVLSQEATLRFVGLFGFRSGREVDKLASVSSYPGVTGCPIVTDYALAALECRVSSSVDVGTHTLFIGEVVAAATLAAGVPMTYDHYHTVLKGKTASQAPTYQNPTNGVVVETGKQGDKRMGKYVCTVCGYVYDPAVGDPDNGVAAGTAFQDLPADWVCPICGATQDQFQPE